MTFRYDPCSDLMLPPKGIQVVDTSGSDPAKSIVPPEKVLRQVVATFRTASGSTGTHTSPTAFIHNPSARLRCSFSVGFEVLSGGVYALGAGAATYTAQAIRRSPEGIDAPLNTIFTTRALPDAYEIDSAVKDIKLAFSLASTAIGTGLLANLVIEARWEPNGVLDMPIGVLLQQCGLSVYGVAAIQNNS